MSGVRLFYMMRKYIQNLMRTRVWSIRVCRRRRDKHFWQVNDLYL